MPNGNSWEEKSSKVFDLHAVKVRTDAKRPSSGALAICCTLLSSQTSSSPAILHLGLKILPFSSASDVHSVINEIDRYIGNSEW